VLAGDAHPARQASLSYSLTIAKPKNAANDLEPDQALLNWLTFPDEDAMKRKQLLLSITIPIMLMACGGGGNDGGGTGALTAAEGPQPGPQAAPPQFATQITFGDGMSDVGTYAVAAIAAVSAAANDLVTLIRQRIVAAGASHVVVNNVPDLSVTPLATSQDPGLRSQVQAMAVAFNQVLKAGLDPEPNVVQVDEFALTQDEVANPASYGLESTTGPACAPNALDGSALLCGVWNTLPVDVSHSLFADSLYPTPYGHALIARQVAQEMARKGWL
jgi:phospholipase/lecithinase/hemolysin